LPAFEIRELTDEGDDAVGGWAAGLLRDRWGSTQIVSRGRLHDADRSPSFVAVQQGQPVGLVTYRLEGDQCEIVSLDSLVEGMGIGAALIDAVRGTAAAAGCCRLWLVTTNDNTAALRFYQKRGFSLVAVHRHALDRARELKPEIPLVGMNGIPLQDEIELELLLEPRCQARSLSVDRGAQRSEPRP
jgi:ribosomal protein S18 acetylase RimI-like enzyme